jgi:ribosomal protein S14
MLEDDRTPSTDAARCARCGGAAEVLVSEDPDWWLCRACADQLGREAVEPR